MFPKGLLVITLLIATCLTLSIPPASSTLQLPSSNQTLPSPPANTTLTQIGEWPPAPFKCYLGGHTDTEILTRTPAPPSDPTSELGVLEAIRAIAVRARAQARLNLIHHFEQREGPVIFRFEATDESFRGEDVGMLLDQLWDMYNRYGKGDVFGRLVKVGFDTAYFEIVLRKV